MTIWTMGDRSATDTRNQWVRVKGVIDINKHIRQKLTRISIRYDDNQVYKQRPGESGKFRCIL